jgi:hypothetical protein
MSFFSRQDKERQTRTYGHLITHLFMSLATTLSARSRQLARNLALLRPHLIEPPHLTLHTLQPRPQLPTQHPTLLGRAPVQHHKVADQNQKSKWEIQVSFFFLEFK